MDSQTNATNAVTDSAPTGAEPATAAQIAKLQASVDVLAKEVSEIHREVDPEIDNRLPSTPEERRKAQWIAAGAMGVITGKIVSLITGTYGIIHEAMKNVPKGEKTFTYLRTEIFSRNRKGNYLDTTLVWGTAGLLLGAIPGAILGFTRGDHIKNSKMLWKEPIQSIKILLGLSSGLPTIEEEKKAAQKAEALKAILPTETTEQKNDPTLASPQAGDAAQKPWVAREGIRRAEATSAEAQLS